MYKVSEAADIVGVEKVEIFEKMITHKTLLDPNIQKKDGVTYFDERGIEILKTLFHSTANHASMPMEPETEHHEPKKEQRLRSRQDKEYVILKKKIEILTNEIESLDKEHEMKDEMIAKYQFKLLEDLELISKLQNALMKKIERSDG